MGYLTEDWNRGPKVCRTEEGQGQERRRGGGQRGKMMEDQRGKMMEVQGGKRVEGQRGMSRGDQRGGDLEVRRDLASGLITKCFLCLFLTIGFTLLLEDRYIWSLQPRGFRTTCSTLKPPSRRDPTSPKCRGQ